MSVKTFIQEINEKNNTNTLISFDAEGKMVRDLNPQNLTPIEKDDAIALVKLLRNQNNKDIKYRVKAAGQSVRDYQYHVLTKIIPEMECITPEVLNKIKIEQPSLAETLKASQPTPEEIDRIIAEAEALKQIRAEEAAANQEDIPEAPAEPENDETPENLEEENQELVEKEEFEAEMA